MNIAIDSQWLSPSTGNVFQVVGKTESHIAVRRLGLHSWDADLTYWWIPQAFETLVLHRA